MKYIDVLEFGITSGGESLKSQRRNYTFQNKLYHSPPIPPREFARGQGKFKDRLEWFIRDNQFLRFARFSDLSILEQRPG
jgi:hypothetical protein